MKKILSKMAVTALTTTVLVPTLFMPNVALAQDWSDKEKHIISQHPADSQARQTAIETLLRERGVDEKSIEDRAESLTKKFNDENGLEARFSNKSFEEVQGDKLNNLDGKTQKYEDSRLKMFTRADWNAIKIHPTAEARKSAIQTLQQERGIANPSISAPELLGAFLGEEKRLQVLEEKKKAEELAKKKAEELAQKQAEKGETDSKDQDSSKSKKLDKETEKKAIENGWAKS